MENSGGGASGLIVALVYLAILVFEIAAAWKMFAKAGKPGWAAIVPIYNLLVLLEIVGKPWWWLLLLFVPVVNIVILLLVSLELAKVFGQGAGFGIGLWLVSFIFVPILGFGGARYVGAGASPTQAAAA